MPRNRKLKSVAAAVADMTLTVVDQELAANAVMETAASAVPVDHSTQMSSWTPPADAEVEAAVQDAVLAEIDPVSLEPGMEDAIAETQASVDFDMALNGVSQDEARTKVEAIATAMDERAAFEKTKNPDNENIHRTLKNARKTMITLRAGSVLQATQVDPQVLNRQIHDGSRYNVYAIGKLADVIVGVSGGIVANKINWAICRSLFRFRAAGIPFTGEMAKAAASDKIRIADQKVRDALVRHTVSASTAPTQASSTMQALETLGVVKREGSTKNPTFVLTDAPIVAKLEKLVAAAA